MCINEIRVFLLVSSTTAALLPRLITARKKLNHTSNYKSKGLQHFKSQLVAVYKFSSCSREANGYANLAFRSVHVVNKTRLLPLFLLLVSWAKFTPVKSLYKLDPSSHDTAKCKKAQHTLLFSPFFIMTYNLKKLNSAPVCIKCKLLRKYRLLLDICIFVCLYIFFS